MNFENYKIHSNAVDCLASHLTDGTLSLFLGAGIQKGVGLPDWETYIKKLCKKTGIDTIPSKPTSDDLQKIADKIKDKNTSSQSYCELLTDCLYSDLPFLSIDLLKNNLLTSICALLMGRRRGKVQRVMTLNFDCILEWYLSYFGFEVRVVHSLPTLEGSEDVRIYHPNGFLPHPSLKINGKLQEPILTFSSANKRISDMNEGWGKIINSFLQSSICLFIGVSDTTFYDRTLNPYLSKVKDELNNYRPTGFWLLKKGEISRETQRNMEKLNIIPIEFSDFDEIPTFLIEICQKPANNILF